MYESKQDRIGRGNVLYEIHIMWGMIYLALVPTKKKMMYSFCGSVKAISTVPYQCSWICSSRVGSTNTSKYASCELWFRVWAIVRAVLLCSMHVKLIHIRGLVITVGCHHSLATTNVLLKVIKPPGP